jgi:hypothetical protein
MIDRIERDSQAESVIYHAWLQEQTAKTEGDREQAATCGNEEDSASAHTLHPSQIQTDIREKADPRRRMRITDLDVQLSARAGNRDRMVVRSRSNDICGIDAWVDQINCQRSLCWSARHGGCPPH